MGESKKLGPFFIERLIGRGGMGAVYAARSEGSETPVALKVLPAAIEEDSEHRERFAIEIETLKRLNHPNIVRLFGFGQEEGSLYYAMEYVPGASLQELLRKKPTFSWEDVIRIGVGVASALRHAHDRGVIHRDIKPANILLRTDGAVKVSDYGIAHFFGGTRLTDAHMVIGTIEYMAPEQATAGPLTPRSDLYSLGALMYVLLTGAPPYPAKNLPELIQKYKQGPPESVRFSRPEVPTAFNSFLMELLRTVPDERPATANLVLRRFESICEAFGLSEAGELLPNEISDHDFVPPDDTSRVDLTEPSSEVVVSSEPFPLLNPTKRVVSSDSIPGDQFPTLPHSTTTHRISPVEEEFDQNPPSERAFFGESVSSGDSPKKNGSNRVSIAVSVSETPPFPTSDETVLTDALARLKHPPKKEGGDAPAMIPQNGLNGGLQEGPPGVESEESRESDVFSEHRGGLPTPSSPSNRKKTGRSTGAATLLNQKGAYFTPVTAEELDPLLPDAPPSPYVSVKVWIFSATLLLVGGLFWLSLRDPSANQLSTRIERRVDPRLQEGEYLAALRASRAAIEQFLILYPSDPRAPKIREYQGELELAELERRLERQLDRKTKDASLSAVESAYVQAISAVKIDLDLGVRKLASFIDLFSFGDGSPTETASTETISTETGPAEIGRAETGRAETTPAEPSDSLMSEDTAVEERSFERSIERPVERVKILGIEQTLPGQCVTLAYRRLERVRESLRQQIKQQSELIESRLELADSLDVADPVRADAIRRAILVFYGDQSWAEEFAIRARSSLHGVSTPNVPSPNATNPEPIAE